MPRRLTHVIGFDDAPFERSHRGDVLVVGAVYAGRRLEGVLSGKVRRDGVNATRVLARLVHGSRFRPHLQLVLLQGIALAGFNGVDLDALSRATGIPVVGAPGRSNAAEKSTYSARVFRSPTRRARWRRTARARTSRSPCAPPISSLVASRGVRVDIVSDRGAPASFGLETGSSALMQPPVRRT
jgi:endonuclease V-like protein UPF0215 family